MELQDSVDAEVRRFVGDDPGRAIIVDVPGRRLSAESAADVVRPGASLLKLLPAIALYRAASQAELGLDYTVTRAELGQTRYPSVLAAFGPHRSLSLREVCALSLITSDNPCAEFLRELLGPDRIGAVAADLGLQETALRVGFSDAKLGEPSLANVTTAREALRLIRHIDDAPELSDLKTYLINNTRNNRIPLRFDEIPVLHKTGSLAEVVNDVGIVYHPAVSVALAFLCERQPDTAKTSMDIGDTTQRIVELVAKS